MSPRTVLLAVGSVAVAAAGQVLLRAGMQRVGYLGRRQFLKPLGLLGQVLGEPRVLVGLVVFMVSAAIWLVVLSRIPLSLAYPFTGLVYLLTAVVDVYLFHESVPGLRWAGIALIVAGIVLVGRSAAAVK